MRCPHCGADVDEGALRCPACQAELGDDTLVLTSGPGNEAAAPLVKPVTHRALVVAKGPETGLEFPLENRVYAIGRDTDSDIFLNDVTVSRRHASLEVTPLRVIIRDLGSLNGTYVRGERVEEAEIEPGDEIYVGKFRLVLMVPEGG